jgi:AraC-like DNA-binding protein
MSSASMNGVRPSPVGRVRVPLRMLLRDTGTTVAATGHEVGYEDAFAFSVAFKRARGVSPSVWRREMR